MFLKQGVLVAPKTGQHLPFRLFLERYGLLGLGRSNHGVDLRCVDACMAEEGASAPSHDAAPTLQPLPLGLRTICRAVGKCFPSLQNK
jgi:hypothetical protein